jgi:hypothetical protein
MSTSDHVELGQRLSAEVLAPMKAAFVGKDEIIDLLGISLVAGEHLFLLGPPGTAKSESRAVSSIICSRGLPSPTSFLVPSISASSARATL